MLDIFVIDFNSAKVITQLVALWYFPLCNK